MNGPVAPPPPPAPPILACQASTGRGDGALQGRPTMSERFSSRRGQGRETRHDLRQIARQAMLDRGLLPDFSDAALEQTRDLQRRGASKDGLRDLRDRLWVSIDNDDSR